MFERTYTRFLALFFCLALALATCFASLDIDAVSAAPAHAAQMPGLTDKGKDLHVQASMSTDAGSIGPNQKIKLDFKLDMDKHWHTYYKDSGEAGLPTKIKLDLPDGFSAGEILWPKPTKFEDSGIVTYGYQDSVTLPIEVTAPAKFDDDLLKKGYAEIEAKVTWLVCSSECVPGKAEMKIALPLSEKKTYSLADAKFADTAGGTIWSSIGMALIGGLILNFMPCVLPVIAIKVMSFLEEAESAPGRVRMQGLAFTAGILSSFAALALLVILLKAGGASVGWGFQFQQPIFVMFMAVLILVMSMSFFGLFYFNPGAMGGGKLDELAEKEGFSGSFFKGVLATVLSTPCTAPFLGTALGFAFAASPVEIAAIFIAAGLGMSSPYILLMINPQWLRFLPRPGLWMDKLKQGLGFVLLATVIWLVNGVLSSQTGNAYALNFSYFLSVVAFCVWLIANFTDLNSTGARKAKVYGLAAAILALSGWLLLFDGKGDLNAQKQNPQEPGQQEQSQQTAHDGYLPFSTRALEESLNQGKTCFVDFTADWCQTCKANEKLVLATDTVKQKLQADGVVTYKADWTKQDPEITALLQKFGRAGVPLYVIFPGKAPDKPIVLPELITVDLVVDKLDEARNLQ